MYTTQSVATAVGLGIACLATSFSQTKNKEVVMTRTYKPDDEETTRYIEVHRAWYEIADITDIDDAIKFPDLTSFWEDIRDVLSFRIKKAVTKIVWAYTGKFIEDTPFEYVYEYNDGSGYKNRLQIEILQVYRQVGSKGYHVGTVPFIGGLLDILSKVEGKTIDL